MALTATYQAALLTRQYNKTANASTKYAAQDYAYEGENLVGVISFGGMDLTGCVISGVSLTITAAGAGLGQWYEKTAYLRKSNYQNATQSGVTGLQYVGDALGTIQSPFHNNTVTLVLSGALLTSVAAYFSAGNNTLTLYNPDPHPDLPGRTYSESYFRWTDVSITVEYEEGASRPTTSASSVALGSAVTISTNRASSSQTHTLTYSFGGASGTIATNVGASASWTPPASLAAQIPNVTSGVCTITCETYYGGALTGTETCQITLTVPDTAAFRPTISAITHEDSVALPSGITGYVQGVSRPEVTITASGARGSTITAYRSVLDGATYTAASFTASRALSASGDLTLNVTVTDSRGRTATASETLTVKAYSRPAITAFSAERCNSDGSTAQRDGSRVRITAAGSVSGLDGQNSIACRVMYKLKSASAWSVGDTVTASGYAVSQTDLLLSQTFNPLQSYDIKLVLTDAFGSAETLAEIGTKTVIMDFKADGTGIAFGKVAETSGVAEFGWPLKLGTPLGVEQGGTGADTAAGAAAALGVLKNKTDTFSGELTITDTGSAANIHMTPRKATSGRLGYMRIEAAANGHIGCYAFSGASVGDYRALWVNTPAYQSNLDNALYLRTNEGGSATNYRVFHAGMASGVPVNKGGTGATNAAAARTNLGTDDAGNITAGTLGMARLPFRIAHGQTTITGAQWQTVTFEDGLFTAAPTIVVSYADNAATSGIAPLKTRSETAAGFEVCMAASSGSGDRKVNWIAVGV